MKSPHTVPIPRHLLGRPLWRGLPVPYVAHITPSGEPDFRIVDEDKRLEVVGGRRCQLCGQPLGRFVYFVGGTQCASQVIYFEPAAHLDCVIYAMQVCPFILGRMEHADLAKVQADNPHATVAVDETYSNVRNPWWQIVKTRDYHPTLTPQGTLLIKADGIIKITDPLHAETMDAADWAKVRAFLL